MVAAEAGAAAEAGVVACVCRHVRGAHYNALSSRSNFCSLSAISPWIAADSYMALMAAAASGLSWLSDWYCPRIASFWACAGGRMAETGQPWWPALPFLGPTPPTPRPRDHHGYMARSGRRVRARRWQQWALTESTSRPSSSALVRIALIERSGDEHTAEIQSFLTSSLKPEP